jgi:hypothetical protein|uniref:Uncharacterized protein n=1 Tax=Zea mays TaxID=4577 RepID=A0A804Q956_MAIZE
MAAPGAPPPSWRAPTWSSPVTTIPLPDLSYDFGALETTISGEIRRSAAPSLSAAACDGVELLPRPISHSALLPFSSMATPLKLISMVVSASSAHAPSLARSGRAAFSPSRRSARPAIDPIGARVPVILAVDLLRVLTLLAHLLCCGAHWLSSFSLGHGSLVPSLHPHRAVTASLDLCRRVVPMDLVVRHLPTQPCRGRVWHVVVGALTSPWSCAPCLTQPCPALVPVMPSVLPRRGTARCCPWSPISSSPPMRAGNAISTAPAGHHDVPSLSRRAPVVDRRPSLFLCRPSPALRIAHVHGVLHLRSHARCCPWSVRPCNFGEDVPYSLRRSAQTPLLCHQH